MEQGGTTTRRNAPTYLAWSIINTLCFCLPLGIIAIVYSSKVNSANAMGNSSDAEDASRSARNVNIAALTIGLIVLITVIVISTTI